MSDNDENYQRVNDDDDEIQTHAQQKQQSTVIKGSGGHHQAAKHLQRRILQTNLDSRSDSNSSVDSHTNLQNDCIPMMMVDSDSKPASPGQDGLAVVDRKFYDLLYYSTQTINVLIFILLIIWLSEYVGGIGLQTPEQIFNYHPALMFLGFIFIYSNAMLIYRSMRGQLKQRLKLFHTILNAAVMVVSLGGSFAAFYFHKEKNITHFYSLHSWLGITTWLLFVSQFSAGFVAFLFPGASSTMRAKLMPFHRFMGLAIFILASVTCITGLNEKALFALDSPKYRYLGFNGVLVNMIGLLICLLAGLVALLTTKSEYQRRPLPEEQVINLSFDLTSSHTS